MPCPRKDVVVCRSSSFTSKCPKSHVSIINLWISGHSSRRSLGVKGWEGFPEIPSTGSFDVVRYENGATYNGSWWEPQPQRLCVELRLESIFLWQDGRDATWPRRTGQQWWLKGRLRATGLYFSLLTLIPAHLPNKLPRITMYEEYQESMSHFCDPFEDKSIFRQVRSTWGSWMERS